MKEKLANTGEVELLAAQKWADRLISQADLSRDLSRTFVHVDMDMFFAAIEQVNPKP